MWTFDVGALSGERPVDAFVDPNDADSSVSIVYTPIPADFSRLSSFGGGKDTIRQYLLPSGNPLSISSVFHSYSLYNTRRKCWNSTNQWKY